MALVGIETLHLVSQSRSSARSAGLQEALAISENRMPFPKLRHLSLINYSLQDVVSDLPGAHVRKPRTRLEDVIHERRAQGAALHSVEVPVLGTIRKIKAGKWNTQSYMYDVCATIARLEDLPEVKFVEEHPESSWLED